MKNLTNRSRTLRIVRPYNVTPSPMGLRRAILRRRKRRASTTLFGKRKRAKIISTTKRRRVGGERMHGRATRRRSRWPSNILSTGIKQTHHTKIFSIWSLATDMSALAYPIKNRTIRIIPIMPPIAGEVSGAVVTARAVEDSNSKYLGCKINMKFTNTNPDFNWNLRYTVVELKHKDSYIGETTDCFALDEFNTKYFKLRGSTNQQDELAGIHQITFLNCRHCSHNTDEYNILKQGYVNFDYQPNQQSNWTDKDISMYIPMRRLLSKDEKANQPFPHNIDSVASVTCYTMRKPVYLVIELMPSNQVTTNHDAELIKCSYFAKHYWRSG